MSTRLTTPRSRKPGRRRPNALPESADTVPSRRNKSRNNRPVSAAALLAVMRDPTASEARRDMMAKAAAPYRHPQLQAIAVRNLGSDGKPIAPAARTRENDPRRRARAVF